jgi:hypothetical protein
MSKRRKHGHLRDMTKPDHPITNRCRHTLVSSTRRATAGGPAWNVDSAAGGVTPDGRRGPAGSVAAARVAALEVVRVALRLAVVSSTIAPLRLQQRHHG